MLDGLYQTLPPSILQLVGGIDLNIQSPGARAAVNDLLQKTVLLGGKRLRPLLTFLIGDLLGVEGETLSACARSIELVHAASLAHDDVIDNATTRRGVDSINIQGSNKMAVLSGDYLLADVIYVLTKTNNLSLVSEMATVIKDLADGEWLQLDAQASRQYSHDIIAEIAQKKTASVMSWCTASPAIIGNFNDAFLAKCKSFGYHLGMAFQLLDDTLDFSQKSNKDVNLDLENDLVNSVIFEWFELNQTAWANYLAGSSVKASLQGADHLDRAIYKVRSNAKSHLDLAVSDLKSIAKDLVDLHRLSSDDITLKCRPLFSIIDYMGNRKS